VTVARTSGPCQWFPHPNGDRVLAHLMREFDRADLTLVDYLNFLGSGNHSFTPTIRHQQVACDESARATGSEGGARFIGLQRIGIVSSRPHSSHSVTCESGRALSSRFHFRVRFLAVRRLTRPCRSETLFRFHPPLPLFRTDTKRKTGLRCFRNILRNNHA
jgi:hypothetical protein